MLKNNPIKNIEHIARYSLAALFCLTLAACGKNNESELAQKTLLYCSEGSPETFNPQLVTSGTTIDAVSQQIYNRLVKINPKTGLVTSDLAQKVIVSEDAMRYRFYLRKDVEFHTTAYFKPTRTLTSEDVLFSFSRILHLDHPFNLVGGGSYPFFSGMGFDTLIEQIIVVDDLTIEFRLSEPQASFLANMATDFAVILSAEYAQQLIESDEKELIDQLPIGTGPFKFSQYKRDHYIRYYAHPNYWDGAPLLRQVIFDITPNNSNRVAKLLTRECDVLGYPSSADVEFLKQKPDIKLNESVAMNVSYWAFNTNVPPFDNPNVRKALSYVVDRQAIIDAVYFRHAEPASTLLPPSSWAYTEANTDVELSLEKAKALLLQEGFEDGFEMDIWAMPVQRVYNPNASKMAEILQQNLAKIGVTANIVTYDWGTFRKKLAQGEHDSVLIGWSADNSDPDNFYRPLLSCAATFSGSNRTAWCNEQYDESIFNALSTADPVVRKQYYDQAERLIFENSPLVPIAHALRYQVHHNYISDVEFNPYGGIGFFQTKKGKN
ncbi:ABC transporter substrate-binding protein [Psychrosphaera saromensis]|uniref:ABC transporter substrate-binding protein n=1 Tax=Psychrosphaera saromensis TaxID=716813 RepID=UPI000CF4357E|nr:ABC transporter substrate-binding protein [Psychrosphaera saromensis]GHB59948.1 ABC transporter substrate-binding protein [Psychrosphaera saromensis]GLQ14367.1 ABC transporter substrate-binding protein [Psychrosphaera saromensis]